MVNDLKEELRLEEIQQDTEEFQVLDDTDELYTKFSDVVTWGADWTIGTICELINKGRIDLNPELQRRDVWNDTKKAP